MVDKTQAEDASINISASGIVPEKPGNNGRNSESHEEEEREVVSMLPSYNGVFCKVTYIGNTRLATGFEHHPADVGVEETLVGIVRIQFGIGIPVVSTMATRPPLDGTFYGTGTQQSKDILEEKRSVVGSVGPETMVTSSNAETGEVVV